MIRTYKVVQCPTTELSYTNKAVLSPNDMFAELGHIAIRYPDKKEAFVFSVTTYPTVQPNTMAFNLSGRKWASLLVDSSVEAVGYAIDPSKQLLNSITFYTDFATRQGAPTHVDFDADDMAKQFSSTFSNQAFTVGQLFGFAYNYVGMDKQGKPFKKILVFELKVKELEAVNIENHKDVGTANVEIGLTTPNTLIMFERAEGSEIKLVGSMVGSVSAPKIFSQNWDFATMGVGGLSEQFNKIFRRAFATRLLPPQYAEAIGAEHVRGILLYGPPGTGKTLIARQIGKMLLAREPKIVNGPEVLNKYVGESEANIRALFKEAEEEQAKVGINSGLHMIIFDEIDAICKSRGSSASTSGVGDNVVNQLLSKIDGVNSLHNVLLVGMTNRRDLIDEALLRPGRLEVQIEIGLPNLEGRLEIFKIHTEKMRKNNVLDASVKLEELAELSKNYTGAEIAGLIKAARSIAVNRVVKADGKVEIDKSLLDSIKITRADFIYAMEHDVKPALGASEDQLKRLAKPMKQWDPYINIIQTNVNGIVKQVSMQDGGRKQPYFVLLLGESGSGLTTIATNMASQTSFPFIRVYQSIATASKTESAKVQYLEKLFDDAARSELSCIVIDGLEVILDYCHIGPRFSNTSRAVLTTIKDLTLPANHKMLIVCTCNDEQFLDDLRLFKFFNRIIKVPSLKRPEQVKTIMLDLFEAGDSPFSPEQINQLVDALDSIPFEMGVKKLESLIEDAVSDEPSNRVRMFLERMHMLRLVSKPSKLSQPMDSIFGF